MMEPPPTLYWVYNKETGIGRWTNYPNLYKPMPNYIVTEHVLAW